MKRSKNADTLLFLLSFTKCQREKILFVSAGAQKRWKAAGSRSTSPQYLPNPKIKFPVKFTFTQNIFVLLSTDKKSWRFH